MKFFILLFGICISLFLETSVIALPLVLIWILLAVVILREEWVLIIAFFLGLFLDSLSFSRLGLHSIFFLVFGLIIFLYEEKFEIANMVFVMAFSFIGIIAYLFIFGSVNFLLQLFVGTILAGILFLPLSFFKQQKMKEIHVDLV